MGFLLKKTLKLDHYEGWKGCYVTFRAAAKDVLVQLASTVADDKNEYDADSMKLLDSIIADHFVSGKAIDEKGETVDITKETVTELPIEMYQEVVAFLVRPTVSPKPGLTNGKES